jgi:N-acetylmuramoyl-L-alanine amidase
MLRLILSALLFVMLQAPAWALSFSTVVIDAGHGGKDGGCVHHGLIEKKICLDVALRLERTLKAKGLRVVMTRRTDSFVSLEQRAAIANRQKNALFVSIHFNASRDKSISGMEVFYRSDKGKTVAAKILRSMDVNCKGVNRGIFYQDLKVLRATRMTAVLVEGGYLSHKTDSSRCATAYHREELAKAIARGILAARS